MIFAACSSRKKAPADPALHPASLDSGTVLSLALQWNDRVRIAAKLHTPKTLYGGRAFGLALKASEVAGVPFYIISAGLGVVHADAAIPAYALTTSGSSDENILRRCPVGSLSSDWWVSAFGVGQIAEIVKRCTGRIYFALSGTYLEMIIDEFLRLEEDSRQKVRIFTAGLGPIRSMALSEFVMPYDARLDGPDSPIPGTKSDFASRAMRHFIGLVGGFEVQDIAWDRKRVEESMSSMRYPHRIERERKSDDEIRRALREAWVPLGGNRQRLLRHLRDDLRISCEQSRFVRIARELGRGDWL